MTIEQVRAAFKCVRFGRLRFTWPMAEQLSFRIMSFLPTRNQEEPLSFIISTRNRLASLISSL